jgi:hypothetical protein
MFEPPKTDAGLRIKTIHDQLIFETMTKYEPSLRDDGRGITFAGVNFPDDRRTGSGPFFRQRPGRCKQRRSSAPAGGASPSYVRKAG